MNWKPLFGRKTLSLQVALTVALTATWPREMAASDAPAIVLEHPRLRLVLGADARWREAADKLSGRDFAFREKPVPCAMLRMGGREHAAKSAQRRGEELRIGFGEGAPVLCCGVKTAPGGLTFTLLRLENEGSETVDRIEFLRLPVTLTERVGRLLGIAWDDTFSICVAAGGMRTEAGAREAGDHALLVARAHAATGLVGAEAVLLAGLPGEMRGWLRDHARAAGLPRNEGGGVDSKDMPAARASYWFLSGVGEGDAERLIALGERSGVRQVLLSQGSWAATTGHYRFHESRFPSGLAGLRNLVSGLHEAGFLVGMHTFVSKVSKNDPYVTPVPDKRFWMDATAVLSEPVDKEAGAISVIAPLAGWPGSPLSGKTVWEGGVDKHRDLIIGEEIVRYESISGDGKQFVGCRRGAYGTRAASHASGTEIRHYGVDGCIDGYIIDQETTLLDEVAARNAEIFNACGFDMVYFDGGEDVPAPHFWYASSRFQAEALARYEKRPLIHMGTVRTHLLWHSFTRGGTVDTYLNTLRGAIVAGAPPVRWPTVREHIDRSVARMLECREDWMPGELGWFGIWPKEEGTDGLQPDEMEYLLVKSLAHDAPVSLQTTFSQMDDHPLTPGILSLVRVYEDLRLSGAVEEAQRARLREPGRDFLLLDRGGRREFVAVRPVRVAGGDGTVRALAGSLDDGGAAASFWHLAREGELRAEVPRGGARLFDVNGEEIALREEGGVLVVPVGPERKVLVFPRASAGDLEQFLAEARCLVEPGRKLWVPASAFVRSAGAMTTGSRAGLEDEDAVGDFIVCGEGNTFLEESWCEYEVEVPRAGRWSLWARLRYPAGGDLSFSLVPLGEGSRFPERQVLGNSGKNGGAWHWDGQGTGLAGEPGKNAVRFWLEEGKFVFRIHPRENTGRLRTNPRLDAICLSEEADYRPTDADARAGLAEK